MPTATKPETFYRGRKLACRMKHSDDEPTVWRVWRGRSSLWSGELWDPCALQMEGQGLVLDSEADFVLAWTMVIFWSWMVQCQEEFSPLYGFRSGNRSGLTLRSVGIRQHVASCPFLKDRSGVLFCQQRFFWDFWVLLGSSVHVEG